MLKPETGAYKAFSAGNRWHIFVGNISNIRRLYIIYINSSTCMLRGHADIKILSLHTHALAETHVKHSHVNK